MAPINRNKGRRVHGAAPTSRLPPRPKRAVTGLNLFVKEFIKKNPPNQKNPGSSTLKRAVAAWKKLSKAQQDRYHRQSAALNKKRNRDMLVWKRQKESLKRPANSYCLFTQEMWKNRKMPRNGIPLSFARMSARVSSQWHNTSAVKKEEFRQQFMNNWAAYVRRREEFLQNLNENGNAPKENVSLMAQNNDDSADESDSGYESSTSD